MHRQSCHGEIVSLQALFDEWEVHSPLAVGSSLIGDLNVHQKKWSCYSNRSSPEGALMQQMCTSRALFFKRVKKTYSQSALA
eukprot:9499136-Pyramimonas_sp.AAC.1